MKTQYISVNKLSDGENIALSVLEITSVPHMSILSKVDNDDALIQKQKNQIGSLLTEVFHTYKDICKRADAIKDISVELLWTTHEIKNQQYKANIRLFIITRAIDIDKNKAIEAVDAINCVFKSALTLQKYNLADVDYTKFEDVIKNINDDNIRAIVKEESAENLQNQLMPYCYNFDKFPVSNSDISRIVNSLTEFSNCAFSIQLIPTFFETNEALEVDRISQALETLGKGIMEQGLGNVSFSLAEKSSGVYKYYSEHKNSPLFVYNMLIFGSNDSISNLTAKILGQYALGDNNASINLKSIVLKTTEVNKNNNFYPLPWAINEIIINKDRNAQIWESGQFSDALYRLPYIITNEEAEEIFRLPIGSDSVSAGLNINESLKKNKKYGTNIINSGDIVLGKLKASSNADEIGFSLNDLAKHMLIVGTPGSGKTTFSVSLLDRLWKEHHIPFLVIEPAKNEYRSLIQSIPDLQVFIPGKNFISPFIFNPFVPPKNVKLETYKSTLKTAFAAAVSMTTPLDKIFEESINNCYSDFRWLDNYTTDNKGQIFNISDFIKCFQNTFDEIGYTGDAKNIGRAGVVRLNSLINLFDNYYSIPIEDLISKPTVIELAAIENADQKSLIISLLLLSILSYVNANYVGEGGLKNLILLEEAHVLLDSDSNHGEGEANPSSIAKGLIKRMLAEIRSYGVSLVIADQSPRKVSTDVVALTDMKVVFRLVENDDKQIIGNSTNMTETQINRLAKLKPGEAFVFYGKLDEPEEIITPDYRLENKISISLSDENIKKLSKYWDNKKDKLRPYPECTVCINCKECDYSIRILGREIARRIFVRNFKPDDTNFNKIIEVFSHISQLIKNELNDEIFTKKLLSCVKAHLWRKLKYNTKIPIKQIQIDNSLKK